MAHTHHQTYSTAFRTSQEFLALLVQPAGLFVGFDPWWYLVATKRVRSIEFCSRQLLTLMSPGVVLV